MGGTFSAWRVLSHFPLKTAPSDRHTLFPILWENWSSEMWDNSIDVTQQGLIGARFWGLNTQCTVLLGVFQMALVVKNPSANAENITRCGFNPWVRKIPWRRKWQPTPVFLPGKSHEHRSLADSSPRDCKRVGHDLSTEQQWRAEKAVSAYRLQWNQELESGWKPRFFSFCLYLPLPPSTLISSPQHSLLSHFILWIIIIIFFSVN